MPGTYVSHRPNNTILYEPLSDRDGISMHGQGWQLSILDKTKVKALSIVGIDSSVFKLADRRHIHDYMLNIL